MNAWLLALPLLLAGCLTEPGPDAPRQTVLECPDYPDGTAVDCKTNLLRTKDIATSLPGLESGWMCVLRHRNDQGLGIFDLYVHQDGRIAYAWDLNIQRQGGFLVVHASVYTSAGNQFLVAAYQPKGFAVFEDRKKADTAAVHLLARHFQLDEKIQGNWTPLPVRPLISAHQGDAWYTLAFDAGHGEEYLSPMVAGEAPRPYEPNDQMYQSGNRELFVDVWIAGAKFNNANIGWPSAGNTRCGL